MISPDLRAISARPPPHLAVISPRPRFRQLHERFDEYGAALRRRYPLLPAESHYFWAYHIRHVLAGEAAVDAPSLLPPWRRGGAAAAAAAEAAAAEKAAPPPFRWHFLPSMVEGADFRLARQWMYAPHCRLSRRS